MARVRVSVSVRSIPLLPLGIADPLSRLHQIECSALDVSRKLGEGSVVADWRVGST